MDICAGRLVIDKSILIFSNAARKPSTEIPSTNIAIILIDN